MGHIDGDKGFLGVHAHTIDHKGRVTLPAKFRAKLEAGCVVTISKDGCLDVLPPAEWERRSQLMAGMNRSSRKARDFARLILSGASEERPDSQGRVLIPENLRQFAGLDKDVVVSGNGEWFEIWDAAKRTGHMAEAMEGFVQTEEAPPDPPFEPPF